MSDLVKILERDVSAMIRAKANLSLELVLGQAEGVHSENRQKTPNCEKS